jgi:tetratricopeptide (TPR) repeat protein
MSEEIRGTCFVVMGFGKKTDFETGRVLDLDKTYRNIIKPAAEAAHLKCVRADEIVHSGLIDVPMYEQLLEADVVIADLSTSNKNAYYELGIRHALRPFTTIIIAEDGIKTFPFDVNHVAVRQYHHMGEDIGYDEVVKFRGVLTTAIDTILSGKRKSDSPIYSLLDLDPPAPKKEQKNDTASAPTPSQPTSANDADGPLNATHKVLMDQVAAAQANKDFVTAKALLTTVLNLMRQTGPDRPDDPTIVQQLALVTYKSGLPTPKDALLAAKKLLESLSPETSNDTETLGLWGAIHKRLCDLEPDSTHLDEAIRAYKRGFYLRNDYYNGINEAYLLNVRAANSTNRAEAIADFVQAQRIRREVLSIAENLLQTENLPANDKYWAMATIAEAHLGLGDEAKSQEVLQQAFAPQEWMRDSTEEQLKSLKKLLDKSPLKYVQER